MRLVKMKFQDKNTCFRMKHGICCFIKRNRFHAIRKIDSGIGFNVIYTPLRAWLMIFLICRIAHIRIDNGECGAWITDIDRILVSFSVIVNSGSRLNFVNI